MCNKTIIIIIIIITIIVSLLLSVHCCEGEELSAVCNPWKINEFQIIVRPLCTVWSEGQSRYDHSYVIYDYVAQALYFV